MFLLWALQIGIEIIIVRMALCDDVTPEKTCHKGSVYSKVWQKLQSNQSANSNLFKQYCSCFSISQSCPFSLNFWKRRNGFYQHTSECWLTFWKTLHGALASAVFSHMWWQTEDIEACQEQAEYVQDLVRYSKGLYLKRRLCVLRGASAADLGALGHAAAEDLRCSPWTPGMGYASAMAFALWQQTDKWK